MRQAFDRCRSAAWILLCFIMLAGSLRPANATILFVADSGSGIDKVRAFDANTKTFITDLEPTGGFGHPESMTVGANGILYVADNTYGFISRFDAATLTYLDQFNIQSNAIFGATSLAFGPDGNLYVADNSSSSIFRYDAAGNYLDQYIGPAAGFADYNGVLSPVAMAFAPDGTLTVADGVLGVLNFVGPAGSVTGSLAVPLGTGVGLPGLTNPIALAYGPDGNLYVVDYGTGIILRFQGTSGVLLDNFVAGLIGPAGLAFGPHDGNLYITDPTGAAPTVGVFSGIDGSPLADFATFSDTPRLYSPGSLAFAIDAVPEPSAVSLVAIGVVGLGLLRRRRLRS